MSDLMLDVGQANEFKLACRRADLSNDDIKRLCEGTILAGVREVLCGRAAITPLSHVIDCDADPFNPWTKQGWKVEKHQKGGQWKFDPKEVEFFLSEGQKGGKVIEGNKLRKELVKKPVFNANVLDYLLAHQHLIPEEWKQDEQGNTRYVFFWGTVYRSCDGRLCVRYLFWGDVKWYWNCGWLVNVWSGESPAPVRRS